MAETTGAFWIATGARFIEEAAASARSFSRWHPALPRILWTDDPATAASTQAFTDVNELSEPTFSPADSIIRPEMLQFDRNLFLDTDTLVLGDLSGALDLLDHADLALRLSPGRFTISRLPDAVREFNTGVMTLRASDEVAEMLRTWRRTSEEGRTARNQPSFTRALYQSGLRLWPLTPEYNLRVRQATYVDGPVRVVHGRPRQGLARLGGRLNRRATPRVVWHLPLSERWSPVLILPCPRRSPLKALWHRTPDRWRRKVRATTPRLPSRRP